MTDETTLPPKSEPKWKRYARQAGEWCAAHPDWLLIGVFSFIAGAVLF